MNELRDLFPEEDYRFRMTMRRGDPANFFRNQDASGKLLKERNIWLDQDPHQYAGLTSDGVALFREMNELAVNWGLEFSEDIETLARNWEADFLLLSPDSEGRFKLRGGALCFPTGWALSEKMNQTLDSIHGVVPGLNPAIGIAIDQLLRGLKPGPACFRQNWGITSTDELNLHPSLQIEPPRLPVNLEELWLRVEHQVLVALPRTHGVLFGIRISLHRLDDLSYDEKLASGLSRSLRTMSPKLASYKGLGEVRETLAGVLLERR